MGIAERFPDQPIYMDHNATTPVLPEVVEAMIPWFASDFGNASSTTHVYGARARDAVARARGQVAAMIGAQAGEIIFTSGATESDNLAIRGVLLAARATGHSAARPHIITCAIEHEAVLETCEALKTEGCDVTVLPVDHHGLVDLGDVARAMTPATLLVSIMLANNEIGTLQPVAGIGRLCRERGVLVHTDAVQAAGRIPIDVQDLRVDLMSLTAHKMHGPKGVGALYVREGVSLSAILHGSGQENRLRSGTLNVPGIIGFGCAAQAAMRDIDTEPARQAMLRDQLWRKIRSRIDDVVMNGHPTLRLPNTLNVAFDGLDSEALLMLVRDVAALSSGSACASGTGKGSYVIRAINGSDGPQGRARSSVRFGLGRSTRPDDIDVVVEAVARAVERLRVMAPAASAARHGKTE